MDGRQGNHRQGRRESPGSRAYYRQQEHHSVRSEQTFCRVGLAHRYSRGNYARNERTRNARNWTTDRRDCSRAAIGRSAQQREAGRGRVNRKVSLVCEAVEAARQRENGVRFPPQITQIAQKRKLIECGKVELIRPTRVWG